MTKTHLITAFIALYVGLTASMASGKAIKFDGDTLEFAGKKIHKLAPYLGRDALYLDGTTVNFKSVSFTNGIIEYDVAMANTRVFARVSFRVQDPGNREDFYMRAHQSGKADSTQYQPVYNNHGAWQLYAGPGFTSTVTYPFDQWQHVKLVIKDRRMDVYIDSDQPVLQVARLRRDVAPGWVSLGAGIGAAHFANLQVTEMQDPPILAMESEAVVDTPKGMITQWQINGPAYAEIKGDKDRLTLDDSIETDWRMARTEASGLLNLAPFGTSNRQKDTLMARTVINADQAGVQKISFGYSDRVRVYANGVLLYSGDNSFRSRDFRYLGTIGLFDHVYVPLKAGENHIVFEVTDRLGGWGLMAQITP